MVKRLLAVQYAQHPHEVLVCFLAFVIGGFGLTDNSISPAVNNALPDVQIGRHFKLLTSYYQDHPSAIPYNKRERA